MGGKVRIAKELSDFLNSNLNGNQAFYDLCCGSMNIISKIDSNRYRLANDIHPYLMCMWENYLSGKFVPPSELSEEEYNYVKKHMDENKALTGFVGFGCSFSGKWFGGYCRDGTGRNYCLNAKNSLAKKS